MTVRKPAKKRKAVKHHKVKKITAKLKVHHKVKRHEKPHKRKPPSKAVLAKRAEIKAMDARAAAGRHRPHKTKALKHRNIGKTTITMHT